MKKSLLTILVFFLIFSLPFLHVMSNKNLWFWNSGDVEDKETIINNTFEFMHSGAELDFFDDAVRSHLYDVRILYRHSIIAFFTVLSLSLILISYTGRKTVFLAVKNACRVNIILWVILGLWNLISFKTFFLLFHELLFSGNYVFPDDNLIIRLFPQAFFENMGVIIGLSEIVFSLLIIYLIKD